jgi:DNA-directed RNA polymerase sigma subunit (sigma70/sigma32)
VSATLQAAQHESIRQMTDLLLSTLEKRERNILRLRYGLLGWKAGEPQAATSPCLP